MNKSQAVFQIGKNGLTEGTIELLENAFKKRENVKICVLKSAGHEKENVKEVADKIVETLGNKFTYRIIGFTIFLKKWRKPRKQ
jgi:RNA-binding protein YhbY